jgi:mono/diheme cytochrome c family protein
VQESSEYPVEIFSEMHYSQASRAQEPPRLQPPASSVVFDGTGGPDTTLDVPATQRTAYDQPRAAELYRVNCSVCHGANGLGNGPAEPHLTC